MLTLLAVALAATCPHIEPLAPDHPHLEAHASAEPTGGTAALRIAVRAEDNSEVGFPPIRLELLGPDGVVRTQTSDTAGHADFSSLPEGQYTLLVLSPRPIRVEAIRLTEGRVTTQRVSVDPSIRHRAPPPGPPPARSVWLRYQRSACFGACSSFEVIVDEDGWLSFEGDVPVRKHGRAERRLRAGPRARLGDRVACAQTLPSFSARQATDFPQTRLDVWLDDGSSWSWIWYGGDFRAPSRALKRFRRTLERPMGIRRFR